MCNFREIKWNYGFNAKDLWAWVHLIEDNVQLALDDEGGGGQADRQR